MNGHATVVGGHATVGRLSNNVFGRFKRFGKILKKVAEWSRDSGWGHATVGRLSNNVCWTFQAIRNFFEKGRWTITWQWSEVTRLSADCQTTIFRRFKQLEIFSKKVAERSRDSGRRSRDRRPTVKQRYLDVSSDLGKFWKKSLNGHATVVEVTRPSADCQTTFFRRFKQLEFFLKKVAERSRDSGWRSRDCRPTVKQRFLDVSSDLGEFWKKSLNGHATVVEVTRPSADCQTTFFGRFKRFGKILKKVAERSRDSGRRSRDRRPTVKQRYLDVSSDLGKFWKKSLNGHVTVVGGHATVGRLLNNVFWTFQAIWENFEESHWTVTRQWLRSRDRRPTVKQRFLDVSSDLGKFWKSRWTVTRQWSEVTRPSADCQTTFYGRFKRFGKMLKKVAERSRDNGWGHATVGRLSNNVFWTFKRFGKILKEVAERSRDSGRGHATVGRLSNNVFGCFKQLGNFVK